MRLTPAQLAALIEGMDWTRVLVARQSGCEQRDNQDETDQSRRVDD
jgi:transposase